MGYGGNAVAVAAIVHCEFDAPFEGPMLTDITCPVSIWTPHL